MFIAGRPKASPVSVAGMRLRSRAWEISVGYAAFGMLWIILSDQCTGIPGDCGCHLRHGGGSKKCLDAGVEGYMEKPINPATIVSEAERFLCPPDKDSAHDARTDR